MDWRLVRAVKSLYKVRDEGIFLTNDVISEVYRAGELGENT